MARNIQQIIQKSVHTICDYTYNMHMRNRVSNAGVRLQRLQTSGRGLVSRVALSLLQALPIKNRPPESRPALLLFSALPSSASPDGPAPFSRQHGYLCSRWFAHGIFAPCEQRFATTRTNSTDLSSLLAQGLRILEQRCKLSRRALKRRT